MVVPGSSVVVGIDPHKKSHTAVIFDPVAGVRVGRSVTLTDDPDVVAKLTAWITKTAPGRAVRIGIEDGRGLARRLADALVVVGHPVQWVPVRLMVAERHHLGSRGKSDPIDALAVAKAAANPDNTPYLSTHSVTEVGAGVAPLVDARDELVSERVRLINNMRWRLHRLGPSLAPADLTTLKAPRHLAATLAGLTDPPDSPLRQVLVDDCEHLLRLTTRINALTRQLDQLTTELCPTLRARRGIGPVAVASLLAELGDPTRVRNGAALARMTGTAPIPVWTGNNERHRLDRGGNRRLNKIIHTIALVQARTHPPAQTLIAKHQHTKGKRGALRILKRHLTDAIWRDLHTDLAA